MANDVDKILAHDDPEVDAVLQAIKDYNAKKIDRSELRAAIINLRRNGTDEQWAEYVKAFNALQRHRDRQYAAERARLEEHRRREKILAPLNLLQRRNRNNPNFDEVQELVETAADIEEHHGLGGSPVIGRWTWTETADYEGNPDATIKDAHGRVIFEGEIPAEDNVEWQEGAHASVSFEENGPSYRLFYSNTESLITTHEQVSWRYVETGNPAQPYRATAIVITHGPKEFSTLEQLFAFLEAISSVDYTPNQDLAGGDAEPAAEPKPAAEKKADTSGNGNGS